MLVSRRYERASMQQQAVQAWDEISGDEVTAAAMIDCLVHHEQPAGW